MSVLMNTYFMTLRTRLKKLEPGHNKYNNFNPHSSLGMLTPNEFAKNNKNVLTG